MEQSTEQPSAAEQRSLAVERLKRATSLPRMKNGRRPAMHVEGVSESEKPSNDGKDTEAQTSTPEPKTDQVADVAPLTTETVENTTEEDTAVATPEQTAKRRSRSRNRRNSKGRELRSPTPRSPTPNGSAFTEEDMIGTSPIQMPTIPPLISPTPSHLGANSLAQLLMLGPPRTPEPVQIFPGSSPSTPMLPATPMLPMLQAIQQQALQQGLIRSNSAGSAHVGRAMALHKLTGGTETYLPSPSISPLPGQLGRNNTVSGGERSAVRLAMLSRLNARTNAGILSDSDQTGTEDSDKPNKRRRRRHSRHRSKDGAGLDSLRASPSPLTSTTPVPDHQEALEQLRQLSATPTLSTTPVANSIRRNSPAAPVIEEDLERQELIRRRSVVVEEEDDDAPVQLPRVSPSLSNSPHIQPRAPSREHGPLPKSSSPALPAPQARSPRYGTISLNPFPTPLREKTGREEEDDDLYGYESHQTISIDREISWVASPVPNLGAHLYNEDEDDDNDAEDQDNTNNKLPPSPPQINGRNDSPPPSSPGNEVLIESDAPSQPPASPISLFPSAMEARETSTSPHSYPARLSVASRLNSEPSQQANETTDSEHAPILVKSRSGEPSTWEKVKNTFSRSGSSTGRRSRSNSIIRRDHTESSVSRESGASLISAKTDKTDGIFPQQQTMHSPSTSVSIMSMGPRTGHSPNPPTVDPSRYTDAKLFPFPGMMQLAENRAKGMLPTSIADMPVFVDTDTVPPSPLEPTTSGSSEQARDGKLSHHGSDSRLAAKYILDSAPATPPPSSKFHGIGSSIHRPTTPTKLPMTLPGVKRWMSDHKFFKSSTSPPATPLPASPHSDSLEKKTTLSDILRLQRKDTDSDWDEQKSDKSRGTARANGAVSDRSDVERTPKPKGKKPIHSSPTTSDHPESPSFQFPIRPIPQTHSSSSLSPLPIGFNKPPSPSTPDPQASLDSLQPKSTSSSGRSTSSQEISSRVFISQSDAVMKSIDDHLAQKSKVFADGDGNEEVSRKLIFFSPVLQVVNSDIVKDRFLLLFSDMLVICKPVLEDAETQRLSLDERKFVVKNAVLLKNLRFLGDRNDSQAKANGSGSAYMNTFVQQFGVNPDVAVNSLFETARMRSDPVALGRLLFRTSHLDRGRLGEYLSRRSSKQTLKAYIDQFALQGLRVDTALRAFLLSICIPPRTANDQGVLEHILDVFAGRWYAANAAFIPYDRELAVRLVRATVQLNEFFHESIATHPGETQYPRRTLHSHDFVTAFRRFDLRNLVSDELLQNIYDSIRLERLSQARNPSDENIPDIKVVIKRAIPTSVTYKVQSEPIVLRIPQADPKLRIELYGQDLIFDPPVLQFAKSAEASFRVTGTSLGSKTMIMCRAGPNALKYSGIPYSNSIMVERAFMRNTFQVAFIDHHDNKRRYMFSVKDPVLRHKWVDDFKRQIDDAVAASAFSESNQGIVSRAAEKVAFRVLQEALLGLDEELKSKTKVTTNGTKLNITHARSKSRSQIYNRDGSSPDELEITGLDDDFFRNSLGPATLIPQRIEGRTWTGKELQIQCQQNALIARLLATLQVWSPGRDRPER